MLKVHALRQTSKKLNLSSKVDTCRIKIQYINYNTKQIE